ncbi:site-specific DNA-methyltransferase [Nostoc edaphicum CCNP1411]|uniref:Site-specific DNA-methyltransferase n=1 Tax=Nostoc edaphicum CCNP1411 TaxID=1472755 RepID=A0A7D7QN21_9NOSO|nr:DUF3102 domain-containing protein [Nostoc edaphicum]QMS92201.1 site-specific DNA-methyltransferase [Nostoc edaphicum CCNP1411]
MRQSRNKDTKDTIITRFDYELLTPEQRTLVEQRTTEIREQLRRTAQDIWEIGQRLAEVRSKLKHGQFDTWLKAEFGWSRRTAYNFINVYETFANRANLAQIDIATSALYLLAAPSTSQKLREQYLEEAKTGKRITHKDLVQTIKHQQKEKTDSITTSEEAIKPEIIAIVPKSSQKDNSPPPVIEVPVTHVEITSQATVKNQFRWWRLGQQHLLFHGDTASPEFFAKIPPVTLAIAVTSDDWDHDWLIEEAATAIILQPFSLQTNTLEQLLTMFSQPGDLVVFPWLPQEDMIAIAHNLQRRVIAGDPSLELCQRAIVASGLSVEEV